MCLRYELIALTGVVVVDDGDAVVDDEDICLCKESFDLGGVPKEDGVVEVRASDDLPLFEGVVDSCGC